MAREKTPPNQQTLFSNTHSIAATSDPFFVYADAPATIACNGTGDMYLMIDINGTPSEFTYKENGVVSKAIINGSDTTLNQFSIKSTGKFYLAKKTAFVGGASVSV